MKKVLGILAGLVLLLVAGYVASAFLIGKHIESAMAEPYKKFAYDPNFKVVKRDYQRGLFAATETVVIELFGDLFRAMGQKPPTVTSVSVINHGPLPKFSSLSAAIVDTEMLLSAGGRAGQKFVTAHTVIGHDGVGNMTATGAASAIDFMDPMGTNRRVSWEAFNGTMQFDADMKNYATQLQMPRFEVSGEDGMRLTVAGIKADMKATQVFPDEPVLHAATQKLTIDEITAKGRFGAGAPMVMRKVVFDSTSPVKGDFLDGVVKSTVAEVLVERQNFGPARMDFAIRHMHGRSLVKVQKAFAKLNKGGAAAEPMAAVQPVLDAGVELLQHNPEFVMERFSFTTPQGEVLVKANAKFVGVTKDDASNPMMLTQKIEASTDIAIPEALLAQFGPQPVSTEAANAQAQKRDQQIARMIEQGYVVREGALLKSKLAYQGGQVTVNGLPFDAMAMMRPQPQVEQPMPMPIPPARPRSPAPVVR